MKPNLLVEIMKRDRQDHGRREVGQVVLRVTKRNVDVQQLRAATGKDHDGSLHQRQKLEAVSLQGRRS